MPRSPILKKGSQKSGKKETAAVLIKEPSPESRQRKAQSLPATKARRPTHQPTLKQAQQQSFKAIRKTNFNTNQQIFSKFEKTDLEFPILGHSVERPYTQNPLAKPKGLSTASKSKQRGQSSASKGEKKSSGSRQPKKQPPVLANYDQLMANVQAKLRGQTVQKAGKSLDRDYKEKIERMEQRLNEQVKKQTIVPEAVLLKRVRFPLGDAYVDEKDQDFPINKPRVTENSHQSFIHTEDDLDLVPGRERSQGRRPLGINDQLVDFARSSANVKMRIETGFKADLVEAEWSNHELVQELNRRLLELDQINEERRSLS